MAARKPSRVPPAQYARTFFLNYPSSVKNREYLKRELARIYSPHTREVKSAMKKLREDINGCPELVVALEQTRWNRNRNSYTARQVRLIAEYLCID